MRTFETVGAVVAACADGPVHLGHSPWHEVTQAQIDLFADATGDHQWIHVDPQRAASSPFGSTIAHGYLTLSLVPGLLAHVYEVRGTSMGMNYGMNRLRFLTPVRVGSRVRVGAQLRSTAPASVGTQMVLDITVEIDGEDKPALVAEVVYLVVPA